jgi:localization factor PodJL
VAQAPAAAPAPQAVVRGQPGSKWTQQPAAGQRRPIAPELPADTPLEPGSAARGRPVASPAERIAASEAALAPVKPQAGEPAGKANFIAAARRAAQAAASEGSPAEGGNAEAGVEAKAGGGLMGRLLANRRRTLMIGIAAFTLVVGSWQIANMFAPAPRTEPPAGARSDARPAKPEQSPMPLNSGTAEPAPAIVPPAPNRQSSLLPTGEMTPPPAGVIAPATEPMNPAPSVPPAEVTGSIAHPQAALAPAPETRQGALQLPATIGGAALRNAALAGDPTAEYEIGLRYTDGRGVPANLEEAARWFERAANQGLTPALYRLGSIYEKGQGVRKNLEAARRLYLAAAGKGNAKAMHNIAVLYAEGAEGKPDYRSAAQWFHKAATHGIADSQYNLGILYARGIGVEQNLAESFKWFSLAAAQGDQDAGKKREDVAARLDKQALVAPKLAVQTWAAEAPPADAMTVAAPAGGWDKADAPAKAKPSAARAKAKSS